MLPPLQGVGVGWWVGGWKDVSVCCQVCVQHRASLRQRPQRKLACRLCGVNQNEPKKSSAFVCALQAYLLSQDAAAADSAGEAVAAEAGASAAAQPGAPAEPRGSPTSPAELSSLAEGVRLPPPATSALLVATGAVAGIASGLLGVG